SPFLTSAPSTKSFSFRNAVTRATRSTRCSAWMRPLISVLSAIGRYAAAITPTAGGPAGATCAGTGVASRNAMPKGTIRRRRNARIPVPRSGPGGILLDGWHLGEPARFLPPTVGLAFAGDGRHGRPALASGEQDEAGEREGEQDEGKRRGLIVEAAFDVVDDDDRHRAEARRVDHQRRAEIADREGEGQGDAGADRRLQQRQDDAAEHHRGWRA